MPLKVLIYITGNIKFKAQDNVEHTSRLLKRPVSIGTRPTGERLEIAKAMTKGNGNYRMI